MVEFKVLALSKVKEKVAIQELDQLFENFDKTEVLTILRKKISFNPAELKRGEITISELGNEAASVLKDKKFYDLEDRSKIFLNYYLDSLAWCYLKNAE